MTFLILAAPRMANADIYECVDAQGQSVWRNKPCMSGEKQKYHKRLERLGTEPGVTPPNNTPQQEAQQQAPNFISANAKQEALKKTRQQLAEEMTKAQQVILNSDPQTMVKILQMQNSKEVQAVLNDQYLMRAIKNGDVRYLQKSKKLQALSKNPEIQQLMQSVNK
ncbi:hypothetical protein MAIT1_01661 [Magnetofaba australis IT-1]|uniref:DUF4124 domain-containing protein n=1 Tax=Magnetofaba australis IT-1 TaxID=1434232 RepID=A0A1Y2K209_9PROT|nr:hypothetical protein MAIT1_01661 [Magnetofaba australis IT-1]